ncbi:MAG: DUF3604 domain-containing protein [Planctomycetota bacterium]|nr:MAG: DUF3604 domain-containing protein [Planctomycetota bacterium]
MKKAKLLGKPARLLAWLFVPLTAFNTSWAVNITSDRSDYATWPSVGIKADGTHWVAWQEFNAGQDANKLFTRPVTGGVPGNTIELTSQWGQYLGLKVAVDGQGAVWFVWSGKENGTWDIWARSFYLNLHAPIQVTTGTKPEYHSALALDQSGRLWIVWEDFNGTQVTIRAKMRDGSSWGPTYDISHTDSNGYSPDIAVDDNGRIWIVWYTFRNSSYDVYARYIENDTLSAIKQVSSTNGFDEYPVVASAPQGGVWVAWRNGEMASARYDMYGMTWYKETFIRRIDATSMTGVIQVPETDLLIEPQYNGPTPFELIRAGSKNVLYVRQPDTENQGAEAWQWAIRGLVFDGSLWSNAFPMSSVTMGYHQPMCAVPSADQSEISVVWQTDNRDKADLFIAASDISMETQTVASLPPCTQSSLSPRANNNWPHYDSHHGGPRHTINYQGIDYNVYFGDIHLHSDNSLDGQSRNGMYDTNLRRVRDLVNMDFVALTDHGFLMNYHDWNESRKWIDIYHQLDGFTAFEAYEWTAIDEEIPAGHGHRNVIYRGSGNTFYSRYQAVYPDILWGLLTIGDAITIPHHPASKVHPMDWDYHNKDFQTLVEVFQVRQNHEYYNAPRVGPDSIQPEAGEPCPPEYIHPALARGHRFGLIASPDHQGYMGEAAVLAPANNRDDLMDAMLTRRTYAVTNSKYFCDFRVDGHLMGEEYQGTGSPVQIYVHLKAGLGFGNIYQVDLFRIDKGGDVGNSAIIYTQYPNTSEVEFNYTDSSPPQVNCAYYVRALQTGTSGDRPEMLWSSPVFVSYHPYHVLVDMGRTDSNEGLDHIDNVGDGDTEPSGIGSRDARKNLNAGQDYYFYFDVDDSFAYQGNRSEFYITIEYYDTGSGNLKLQYDSSDPAPPPDDIYKNGGSVSLTGTDTWKEHTYHISDAYFGNRQNGGADFRIGGGVGNTFYLDLVKVVLAPQQASNPSPPHLATGVAITADLSWAASDGATSYDVYFGTGSPGTFQGNQQETTFDPGVLDWDTDYFWHIDAIYEGIVIEGTVWNFKTTKLGDFNNDNDVDQEDFGHFQQCLSGTGNPYQTGCSDADFNLDGDVDLSDFNQFNDCMNGANVPPDC